MPHDKISLTRDLENIGIKHGDTILMHSSYKSVGTDMPPEEFLRVIIDYLGTDGTLLLPALSYKYVSADQPLFIINETPPCIGLLPTVFFKMPGVVRSMHPTHSVCAYGKNAVEITKNHYLDDTPVGKNSPYMRLPEFGGKILMLGPVMHALTFMHGVEEIANTPYTLQKYKTRYITEDENGIRTEHEMYRHDFSDYNQEYPRVEALLAPPELVRGFIGDANSALIMPEALIRVGCEKIKEDPYYFVSPKK